MSRQMSEHGMTPVDTLALETTGDRLHPIVVVRGEIDVATSPRLRDELTALLAHGAGEITLDLTAVSFIDSSGLGVLVGALKRLRDSGGGTFNIVAARDGVRRVFEITGLDQLFVLRD
jgi:anti-sigma B factor antagonist